MAAWKLSIGNLISRAPEVAVADGSTEDPLYLFEDFGNGYPDDPSRWVWEADGVYEADFDLNLLAATSARVDAPSGWSDLALRLAGTPGLGPDPVEQGTFETRADSLKLYRPIFQDIDVMPGEDLLIECGLRVNTASDATAVRLEVIDLKTGKHWDATANAWNNSTDPVAEQSVLDTWLDVSETIVSEAEERTTYRVILSPVGGTGATFYVFVSDPALTAAQDFVALIGNNVPAGATMEWDDGTSPRTIVGAYPSCYATGTSSRKRFWSLSITMPANQIGIMPAPYVGELWAGRLVDLAACPIYPFDILEGDISQQRLQGGLGREYVATEAERQNHLFTMKFKTTNVDQYQGARDAFLRACRYGADPVIVAPVDAVEGAGTIWHGRVSPEATFSLTGLSKRTFEIKLRESPFPRFR